MRNHTYFTQMVEQTIEEAPELIEIKDQIKASDDAERSARVEVIQIDRKLEIEEDPHERAALIEARGKAQTSFEEHEQRSIKLMKREKDVRKTVTAERGLAALFSEDDQIREKINQALKGLAEDIEEVREIGKTLRRYRIPWEGPDALAVDKAMKVLRSV